MKKLFLLGALVYVGQLFGMENPQPQLGVFGYLPTELHEKIIQDAIASSDTVEGVIKAINAASVRGARYDNIKDFTKLVIYSDTNLIQQQRILQISLIYQLHNSTSILVRSYYLL